MKLSIGSGFLQIRTGNVNACRWPPIEEYSAKHVTNLVKNLYDAEDSWPAHLCELKKYYARDGAKQRVDDSSYETDHVLGRGHRKTKVPQKLQSSDESDDDVDSIQEPTLIRNLDKRLRGQSKAKPSSPVKIFCSKSGRNDQKCSNKSVFDRVRKTRGSEVSSPKGLFDKLKEARENRKSGGNAAPSLVDKVKDKGLSNMPCSNTAPLVVSTSPGKRISPIVAPKITDKSTSKWVVSPSKRSAKQVSPTLQPFKKPTVSLSSTERQKSTPSEHFEEDNQDDKSKIENTDDLMDTEVLERARKQLDFPSGLNPKDYHARDEPSKEDSSFAKLVLISLSQLHEKVETISANQTKLNLHLLPNEKVISRPAGIPTLPLSSVDNYNKMEKYLKVSSDNLSAAAIYLSTYVSKDARFERKSAMKVMSKVMTNSLACKFNFRGQGEKLSFEQSELWKVVQGAVVYKVEDTDLSQTVDGVKRWIKAAPWRFTRSEDKVVEQSRRDKDPLDSE